MAVLTAQERNHPIDAVVPCVSLEEVVKVKKAVTEIRISDELKRYIVEVVSATRVAAGVQLGASPRASIALMKVAQALALFDGRAFVMPEHIQEIGSSAIAHRLVLDPQARFSGLTARQIVEQILSKISVPA